MFYEIGYGFSEAIKTGKCGRHLHEIVKECDCFSMGGVMYLIARELKLQPTLYFAHGMKDVREGASPERQGTSDHAFITVQVKKGEEYVVDRHMGVRGKLKGKPQEGVIEIHTPRDKEVVIRSFSNLRAITQGEYLAMLQEHRSPQGGRKTLAATQKVQGFGGEYAFITFLQESQELKSSLRYTRSWFVPEKYTRHVIYDLTTKVNSEGSYDFSQGTFSVYNASGLGWSTHTDAQVPFKMPVVTLEKLWPLWDSLIAKAGRKSPVNRLGSIQVAQLLLSQGFNDALSFTKGSAGLQTILQEGHEERMAEFTLESDRLIREYILQVREDELSHKVLLRRAQVVKMQDKAKSKENPFGLVYDSKRYEALIQQAYDSFVASHEKGINYAFYRSAISARLEKGSLYHTKRKFNAMIERGTEGSEYFNAMCAARKSKDDTEFHIGADSSLLHQQFDIDALSVPQLQNGLTENEVYRAAQEKMFFNLINIYRSRKAFMLQSYKKGIERILKQE